MNAQAIESTADIVALEAGLDAAERDARALVEGLAEAAAGWRDRPGSWSVAECLDHLATSNEVYLEAMRGVAADAAAHNRTRKAPARPGVIGRLFVRWLEPPVSPWLKGRAPRLIRPRPAPALTDASNRFLASQKAVRAFLRRYSDIDLAGVRFPNPFIRGVRFSLATGLHVLEAHERRHLWQAWRTRRAAEQAIAGRP